MKVSFIVAMSQNRVIGKDGKLPWHLPADLALFQKHTLNKPIIMGRKTWESIGSKPLPKRENIIVSRQKNMVALGATLCCSLEEVWMVTKHSSELMVIGGNEIFQLFLPYVACVYLSTLQVDVVGDAFFPLLPTPNNWQCVHEEWRFQNEKNAYDFKFQILERDEGASDLEEIDREC